MREEVAQVAEVAPECRRARKSHRRLIVLSALLVLVAQLSLTARQRLEHRPIEPEDVPRVEPPIPTDLASAVAQLDTTLSPELQAMMLSEPDARWCAVSTHFHAGMWIRNNWRLWGGGPLAEDPKARGFWHPDDMSGVILQCWCHGKRGEPCDVLGLRERYAAHWEYMREPVSRFNDPPSPFLPAKPPR